VDDLGEGGFVDVGEGLLVSSRVRRAAAFMLSVSSGMACSFLAGPGPRQLPALLEEARDLNLPVESGVRDGRNAFVRWAVSLEEVLP
jgi:hypothetical protein